jgi:hypothetical protein
MTRFNGVTIVNGFACVVVEPIVTLVPKTAVPGVCIFPEGVEVPIANLLFDIILLNKHL